MEKKKHLLIFDFDGVLRNSAKPKNAIPYDNIHDDLAALHRTGDYVMAIASFNPRAKHAIESWGLASYFTCFRCGSNEETEGMRYFFAYAPMLDCEDGVLKSKQISSMLQKELAGMTFETITFFDDAMTNIIDVMKEFSRRKQRREARAQLRRKSQTNTETKGKDIDVDIPFSPIKVECVFVDEREGFQTHHLPIECLLKTT